MVDEVREIDIGFVPNAGTPEPILVQGPLATALLFWGQRTEGPYEQLQVLVDVIGCSICRFGCPNDEALPGHPLYAAGLRYYGVYEVLDSSWDERLRIQNRVSFPATERSPRRHYVITFHDETFECLARGVRARLAPGSVEDVLGAYLRLAR